MRSKTFAVAAVLAMSLAVSGCVTSGVRANVSAFSELTQADAGKTVFVAPYKDEDANSLEWRSYGKVMEQHLAAKGFVPVKDPSEADLLAFMGYAIDDGEQVTSTYSIPEFGVIGYSGAYTTGSYSSYGGMGSYSSTTNLTPQYGITGYTTGTSVDRVYTRSLAIDIVDAKTFGKLWEMELSSSGSCSRFAGVAPALFDAAFQSFPQGEGGTVRMDWDESC